MKETTKQTVKPVIRTSGNTTGARPVIAKKIKQSTKSKWEFPLNKTNFIILGCGLLAIILGFVFMATGIGNEPALPDGNWNNPLAVTFGPLLLVIGYCIIIPLGILKSFSKPKQTESPQI